MGGLDMSGWTSGSVDPRVVMSVWLVPLLGAFFSWSGGDEDENGNDSCVAVAPRFVGWVRLAREAGVLGLKFEWLGWAEPCADRQRKHVLDGLLGGYRIQGNLQLAVGWRHDCGLENG